MSALSSLIEKLKGGKPEEQAEETKEGHSEHDHDTEEEKEACQFC